ncbi:MAG: serine hydrolase domain-containing protein [Armatimonadota bacterium]
MRRDAVRIIRWLGNLLCVLLLLITAGRPAWTQAKGETYSWQPLTNTINGVMARDGITGLSIVVVRDQQILYAKGFGYANAERKMFATPNTVYPVGALAQPLTAAAVLMLDSQGKLDIDKPLRTSLPQFTIKSRFPAAGPITPRNIMAHHAGLPSYWLKGLWGRPTVSFTEYTGLLKAEFVSAPPDQVYTYSEVGYGLLGQLIQRVSGKDFATYLDDALFTPLGMTHTSFTLNASVKPLLARGYQKRQVSDEPAIGNLPGAGLYTSVNDMALFLKMIFAGGKSRERAVLRASAVADMLRAQYTNLPLDADQRFGLGWEIGSVKPKVNYDGPAVLRSGDTLLFHSQVILLPQEKLAVVVLANSANAVGAVNDLAHEGIRAALEAKTDKSWYPAKLPDPGSSVKLGADQMQALTGAYSLMGELLTIKVKSGRLSLSAADKTLEMVPRAGGRFTLRARLFGIITLNIAALRDTNLSFATLAGRRVIVAEQQGKRTVVAVKLSPAPIPAAWQKRLGSYAIANPDQGSALKVSDITLLEKDGLLIAHVRVSPGGVVNVPITPIDTDEAVTAGLGRGMGETLRIVKQGKEERLCFSGFEFRRTGY